MTHPNHPLFVYVPPVPEKRRDSLTNHIAGMLEDLGLGATVLRKPPEDPSRLSMVVGASELVPDTRNRKIAKIIAEELGRDVLLVCDSQTQRENLRREFSEDDYSMMVASTETILRSALKTHVDAQKLRAGYYSNSA